MTVQFIRDRITQLRLQKGISEYKMSYDLGHSRGYINNISSGKTLPSMTEFLAICDYFGITPVQFFEEKNRSPMVLDALVQDLYCLDSKDLELVSQLVGRLPKAR